MTMPDISPWIALATTMVRLIADAIGETTDQVIARVRADCRATALDPSDETEEVTVEIDAALPPPMPGSGAYRRPPKADE